MALDDRDYLKEKARTLAKNDEPLLRMRARFESATPETKKSKWEINIPLPETNWHWAGLFAVVASICGLIITIAVTLL